MTETAARESRLPWRRPVDPAPKTKSRYKPAFSFYALVALFPGGLGCFGHVGAIEQFHKRHRRIVALAETEFQDAQITAIAIGESRTQIVEQLQHHLAVAQPRKRQA